MKQRQETQKQYHSTKQSPSKHISAPPNCSIQTVLHLYSHSSPQVASKNHQSASKSQERNFLSPNVELSQSQPNKMVFHHYQKFNTFQFQFDHIFQQATKNIEISNYLNIYNSLLKQGKDVAVMAMGTQQSGLQSLIQGKSSVQDEGLYFTLISQLWHSIKEHEKTDGLNSIKIILRFLVVWDEKLYDLFAPKNEVELKDSGYKFTISGCCTYEVKSLYEFYEKLMQAYKQRRLLYSQSIMIVEAELAISKEGHFISDQDITRRYFTFVQWQKSAYLSSTVKSKENNNQSLLTFNMCIYQLYKISCHNPQKMSQSQLKKLWSNFRNSYITMLIKHCFMRKSRVVFFACISLKESQEQDSFQVLMVAKNLAKIDLSKFTSYHENLSYKSSKESLSRKKMKTQPVQAQSYEDTQNMQLSRIKQNLKRILKEKEEAEQLKEKQDEIILLMKEEKRKKKYLQNIRYRKQEIKVRQDINRISMLNSKDNSRVILNRQQAQMVSLPSINLKKPSRQLSEEEVSRLQKQQEKAIQQIDHIHQRIIQNVEFQSSPKLAKSVFQMEIKLHEKDIVEYVTNKNKILSLLKQQVSQIKSAESEQYKSEKMYDKKVSFQSITEKRKIKSGIYSPFLTIDTKEESIREDPQKQLDKEEEEKPSRQIFKLQNLKKMNKNNYLFEKRRQRLRAKVSKGREQVNQFYEQAAKKFQQYHPK